MKTKHKILFAVLIVIFLMFVALMIAYAAGLWPDWAMEWKMIITIEVVQ